MPGLRLVSLALLVALLAVHAAAAQSTVEIRGDRLSGFALPVTPRPGAIRLTALRGSAWTVDDTKRLVLERDVEITVAGDVFRADRAVVWLNRLPVGDVVVNQVAIFFDDLRRPERGAGLTATGRNLLVTGSTVGEVTLDVARLERDAPRPTIFRKEAESRLAAHLRGLLGDPPRLATMPRVDRPVKPDPFEPRPVEPGADWPTTIELPRERDRPSWLRAPDAVVTYSADEVEIVATDDVAGENVVTAIGSIFVEYFSDDPAAEIAQLTLTAERAVIFSAPGSLEDLASRSLGAEQVLGVYLEGQVVATARPGGRYADDWRGEQQVRAPRMYYDFTTGRAIMLDAVLRTYARDGRVPVYARASELRQIARDQWSATDVRVSASEFKVGHISLGADRMLVTRDPDGAEPLPTEGEAAAEEDAGGPETRFSARNVALRLGTVPIFAWPGFEGTIVDVPLRSVSVGGSESEGVSVETKWSLFSLLGTDAPKGVDAEVRIDGYTKRGAAIGLAGSYQRDVGRGAFDFYGMYDDGTDRTSEGRDVEQDDAIRGYALWEHDWKLSKAWRLQLQGSWISDPSFISTWREDDFRERREYETSVYLAGQTEGVGASILTKYALNDFISNDWLLASQQFTVDRVPDLRLRFSGVSLLRDTATYSSETRATRMRFVFESSTPDELGAPARGFGVPGDVPISDALSAEGLTEDWVNRFDTRHEIRFPSEWGAVHFTPFLVGRLTAYDHDFEEFSSDSDSTRLFGAAGLRMSTQFQHIDDSVESRAFDLHRLRHVVEPEVTLWYGYATVSEDDLPVYDPDVESLGTGAAVRFGVRNTWQTQRGGPGRWRTVDVLAVNAAVVLDSNDANRESPVSRFYEAWPEYSQFGDHVAASAAWAVTDTLTVAGEGTWDLEDSVLAAASIGTEMQHSPILSTFVEYRYLDASDTRLLDLGWNYMVSPKYRLQVAPQWDFRENDFRAVRLRIERSFPDFTFSFIVRYDAIKDQTSIGASLGLVEF